MSKIDLSISSLDKFVDIRDTIPGDSYNWSWVRPLSQVKYLAIHHSAGPDTQTPEDIANYHINHNGWGGIGYHFLIGRDGTVYYVGDISTARANVSNLNEQVLGICVIGNFTLGRLPSNEQFDSAHKLCDFFINYPDLVNVSSWTAVLGHKDLPGQSTVCPGDNWSLWREQIVGGVVLPSPSAIPDRGAQITELYRIVLGRDPDSAGLQTYTNGPLTFDEIMRSLAISSEHQDLILAAKEVPALESRIDSLQTSLASINQQVITLRETLQEREREIADLKSRLSSSSIVMPSKKDTTLTLFEALVNLYKFIFWPRKVEIS